MARFIKIGNINDLGGDAPLALPGPTAKPKRKLFGALGQSVREVSQKGIKKAQRDIEERFGLEDGSQIPPGALEGQMTEEQAEEALAGLGQALHVVNGIQSREARRATRVLTGLVEAIAGELDAMAGDDDDDAEGFGGADVIGLTGAGGLVSGSFSDDEWR